jgi:hypothetical protein
MTSATMTIIARQMKILARTHHVGNATIAVKMLVITVIQILVTGINTGGPTTILNRYMCHRQCTIGRNNHLGSACFSRLI